MSTELSDFDITSIPFDFNPLNTTLDGALQAKQYEGDDKLPVQFKTEAVLNPSKSTKAGRHIYDDVDMVIIHIPGSQLTRVVAPMKGEYMVRFGERYRKWKAGQAEALSGTPLDSFPFLLGKPSVIAELKAMNIRTVEQLAELPDNYKQRIMGGFELSRRAAAWVDQTQGVDAKVAQMAKENDDMRAQMEELKRQMAEMVEAPKARAPLKKE